MDYVAQVSIAKEIASKALTLMEQHNVPLNPNNFTVWFHYVAESYPALNRMIDLLIKNDQSFDIERNEEIYHKFFTVERESDVVRDAAQKADHTLERLMIDLGIAARNNSTRCLELSSVGRQLEQAGHELPGLSSLINAALMVTRRTEDDISSLSVHLERSLEQIKALHGEISTVRNAAITDEQTGVHNRPFFNGELKKECRRSELENTPVSLLLLDIDDFKTFNRANGVIVGDQVLKLVARTIADSVKGRDIVARFGDDEFAVILPRTVESGALALAGDICNQVAGKNVVNRISGQRLGRVTLSAGATTYREGESIYTFVERAKNARDVSRAKGGNQACKIENCA